MNSKPIKVDEQLEYLKLRFMGEQYRALADEAAKNSWSHQQYFECLIKGETDLRWDNGIKRRITMARFPVLKTMDQFHWTCLRLGTYKKEAILTALSRKGPWHCARTLATQAGMTNKWLAEQGLISVKEQWVKIHYPATAR